MQHPDSGIQSIDSTCGCCCESRMVDTRHGSHESVSNGLCKECGIGMIH